MTDPTETPFPRPLSGDLLDQVPSGVSPARMPLVGQHVDLEPLLPDEHGDALYRASHENKEARQVWDYLPDGPWATQADFDQWLTNAAAPPAWVTYAVCPRETGRAAGMASFLDIQPQAGVIEIGYIWFAPDLQRTRAATEALYLLIAHAMDDLGYRRMQWRCNSLNAKSRVAARRLGYRFEGIFHHHMVVKGRNRDTAWYSILDHEWPEIREIIEAWLADDNFDAQGVAKTSLAAEMAAKRSSSAISQ